MNKIQFYKYVYTTFPREFKLAEAEQVHWLKNLEVKNAGVPQDNL
jgi:hypothetical protein